MLFHKNKKYFIKKIIGERHKFSPFSVRRRNFLQEQKGCYISKNIVIKKEVVFSHGISNIYISDFTFGGQTYIQQNVTIGDRGKREPGESAGFLYIGAGAFVAADCKIGNNVIIGANATITKNLPDNCVAYGVNNFILNKTKVDEYKTWLRGIFGPDLYGTKVKRTNMFLSKKRIEKYKQIYLLRKEADGAKKERYIELKNEYKKIDKKYKHFFNLFFWTTLYRIFIHRKAKK